MDGGSNKSPSADVFRRKHLKIKQTHSNPGAHEYGHLSVTVIRVNECNLNRQEMIMHTSLYTHKEKEEEVGSLMKQEHSVSAYFSTFALIAFRQHREAKLHKISLSLSLKV